jgi:hypothetical protein
MRIVSFVLSVKTPLGGFGHSIGIEVDGAVVGPPHAAAIEITRTAQPRLNIVMH